MDEKRRAKPGRPTAAPERAAAMLRVISRKVIAAPDLPAGDLDDNGEGAGVVLVPDDRLARPSR